MKKIEKKLKFLYNLADDIYKCCVDIWGCCSSAVPMGELLLMTIMTGFARCFTLLVFAYLVLMGSEIP